MSGGFGHVVGSFSATVGVAACGYLVGAGGQWPSLPAMRVEVMLAVLALGVLPRFGVTLGGLAAADFLVRSRGDLSQAELSRRVRSSGMRLAGVALGLAVVASIGGYELAAHGGGADQLAATLAGLCMIVRSRLLERTWTGVALAVAGLAVCFDQLIVEPSTSGLRVEPLVAAVLVGLLLAVMQTRRSRPSGGRMRMLHWAEATGVMAMVCTTAVASGLLSTMERLVG